LVAWVELVGLAASGELVAWAVLVGLAASAAATGRRSFPQTLAAAIGNTIPNIAAALPIGTALLQIGSAAQLAATP
jgi:hypothetical protein